MSTVSGPAARRVSWTEERAERGTSEHATKEAHANSATVGSEQ